MEQPHLEIYVEQCDQYERKAKAVRAQMIWIAEHVSESRRARDGNQARPGFFMLQDPPLAL